MKDIKDYIVEFKQYEKDAALEEYIEKSQSFDDFEHIGNLLVKHRLEDLPDVLYELIFGITDKMHAYRNVKEVKPFLDCLDNFSNELRKYKD